jgi:hypothetical protein
MAMKFPMRMLMWIHVIIPNKGLESEIAPETQLDPDSEVTDVCDPSKSALDKHVVSHENFDMDANDS